MKDLGHSDCQGPSWISFPVYLINTYLHCLLLLFGRLFHLKYLKEKNNLVFSPP